MRDWYDILSKLGKPAVQTALIKAADVPGLEYNDAVKELHALAVAGAIFRWRDAEGNWVFSTAPEVIEARPFEVPKNPDDLPDWAKPPVWNEGCGPTNGVWAEKPRGERCIYSTLWSGTSGPGVVPMIGVWSLDSMSDIELLCELKDVASRTAGTWQQAECAQEALNDIPGWTEKHREAIEALLRKARQGYIEVVAPWCIPPNCRELRWRPGWGHTLGPDERFAMYRGGGWGVFPRNDPLAKGIRLSDPPRMGGLSDSERKLAAGYPVVTSEGIS